MNKQKYCWQTYSKLSAYLPKRAAARLGAMGLLGSAIATLILCAPAQATCEIFSAPQQFNTQIQGDVVVIGYQTDRRYQVILPIVSDADLADIRNCVTDAYITRSRIGDYIHVGSFGSRREARDLRRILNRAGHQARVVYVR
ncbi:MAG: hypothetical protein AAFY33_16470 [Cyanobacteria bacterium J06643_4]